MNIGKVMNGGRGASKARHCQEVAVDFSSFVGVPWGGWSFPSMVFSLSLFKKPVEKAGYFSSISRGRRVNKPTSHLRIGFLRGFSLLNLDYLQLTFGRFDC